MAIHEKKTERYRKEGSDEAGVCSPPALTTAFLFFLLPPNPYSPQCKQKLCHLHTCPAPGAGRRERVHPQSSCTIQGLLPVLILSTECSFTGLFCSLARVFWALLVVQEDRKEKERKKKNYPLALNTWFSPAMWPVVPHQGMIRHEETPGSNKKQAAEEPIL